MTDQAALVQISEKLRAGDNFAVIDLVKKALAAGIAPKTILDEGMIAGMTIVGEQFRDNLIFLPEVLIAARAMHAGLDILKPELIAGKVPSRGKVILGTVKGDLHDIGKNLVAIMLQGAGYDVIDLGTNVPPDRFIDTALGEGIRIIGMSALLTTTMVGMKQVIDLINSRGLLNQLKTVVGGAPLTARFAEEIGANGYARNAVEAVKLIGDLQESASE